MFLFSSFSLARRFFYLSFPIFSRLTLRALLAGHLVVDDVLGPLDCLFCSFYVWTRGGEREREARLERVFQDFVDERPRGKRASKRARREAKTLENDYLFVLFLLVLPWRGRSELHREDSFGRCLGERVELRKRSGGGGGG